MVFLAGFREVGAICFLDLHFLAEDTSKYSLAPLYGEKSINIVELSNDLLGWFFYPILYPCRT